MRGFFLNSQKSPYLELEDKNEPKKEIQTMKNKIIKTLAIAEMFATIALTPVNTYAKEVSTDGIAVQEASDEATEETSEADPGFSYGEDGAYFRTQEEFDAYFSRIKKSIKNSFF